MNTAAGAVAAAPSSAGVRIFAAEPDSEFTWDGVSSSRPERAETVTFHFSPEGTRFLLKRVFSRYIAQEARPMLALATPIVLAELGWMTMGIVDTMMVGRQADSAVAIGAVSLGSILYYAVAIFGAGLMLGLDTLVSHAYGAGDLEDTHRSLVNGVYLSIALTPLLMGLIRLGEPALRVLHIPDEVLSQAIPYLRAINWSTFPLLLFF